MIWYSLPEGIVVYIVSAHHLHPRRDQTSGSDFILLLFISWEVRWLAEEGVTISWRGHFAAELVKAERLCQKLANDQNQKVQQTCRWSFILLSTYLGHFYSNSPLADEQIHMDFINFGQCWLNKTFKNWWMSPTFKENNNKLNILVSVGRFFFLTISIQMSTNLNIPWL